MKVQSLALVTLLLLLIINIEGNPIPKAGRKNATSVSSSSPQLKKVVNRRLSGCQTTPWVCSQGEFPPRRLCCGNRCVDVTSDANNCGVCGLSCLSSWQCCQRLCINTNVSPMNCGRCGNVCPIGRFCLFGFCTAVQPLPIPLPPPLPFLHGLPNQKPPQPPQDQPQYPPGYHQPPAME